MSEQSKQKVVCILGMHRSGTSAVTRIANLIGVYLGPDNSIRIESAHDNVKGHWEHKEIALINEAIFQRFGGSWREPPIMPDEWEKSPVLDDLRIDAQQLIVEEFARFNLWGWKDPRTCLTLKFWQQFIGNVHYILCLRNPADVASSLKQREGFPAAKSFQLWLTYVGSALKYTDGKPRITIFYEDIVRSPIEEMTRIAEFLEQPEIAWKGDALATAEAFVEKGLQHHSSLPLDTTVQSCAERSAKSIYLAQRICNNALSRETIDQLSNALQTLKSESEFVSEIDASQPFERNEIVARLLAQIEEQGTKARDLSNQLRQKQLELERIKNTLGFRILNRCWNIKHRYLVPLIGRSRSNR